MMDGFNKDGKVDIYRDIFDGKTNEEIIALCEEYLGKFNGQYFDNKLIDYDNHSRTVIMHNLRDAINESREEKMKFTAEERDSVLKDFGMTGATTPLSALASKAIQEEATAIVKKGFFRNFDEEPMDKDELERRINLVLNCCGSDTLSILMQSTIPQFYYGDDSKYVEDMERLSKDLPQFFQAVDFLVNSGVDISKIEMKKYTNLQDVYMEVSRKYAKFFSNDDKEENLEEEEINLTEESIPEENYSTEISEMVDEAQDTVDPNTIMEQIQRNQEEMERLIRENANLIDQLNKLNMKNGMQK